MRIFILFFLLLPSAWGEVYMLSEPIRQTVKTPRAAVGAVVTFDLVWTSATTFGIFQVTGEPVSTAAYFGLGMLEGIPTGNVYIQSLNRTIAQWKNRGTLKKVAGIPGVKEIRLLNTGHVEQAGIYSSNLHSAAFVFVEAGSELPSPIDGKEWIPLTELADTKIRFSLQLPNGTTHPTPLEIGLQELFAESKGDQAVLASWRSSINEWQRSQSFADRFLRHKGLNDLKVTSELSIRGESFSLGEFSQGKGVKKIVGLSPVKNLKAWISGQSAKGRESWTTRNIEILRKGGCSTWYKRIVGRKILAE